MEKHWLEDYIPRAVRNAPSAIESLSVAIADPLRVPGVARPTRIRRGDGRIEWCGNPYRLKVPPEGIDHGWEPGVNTSHALWHFIALADEPDDDIIFWFAQNYGVLAVREVEGRWFPYSDNLALLPPLQVENEPGWLWESFAVWRTVAAHFRTVLTLASYLKRGELVPEAEWVEAVTLMQSDDQQMRDWFVLASPHAHARRYNLELSDLVGDFDYWYKGQLVRVEGDVSRILKAARLAPGLSWWFEGEPRIELRPQPYEGYVYWFGDHGGLFPVLALQLVAAITQGVPLERCDKCGIPYQSLRKARSDQKHYCERCRKVVRRESTRQSVAKRRARQRGGDSHDSQK